MVKREQTAEIDRLIRQQIEQLMLKHIADGLRETTAVKGTWDEDDLAELLVVKDEPLVDAVLDLIPTQKVYILEGIINWEGNTILGVFPTRQSAQELLDKELAKEYARWGSTFDAYDIDEHAVELVEVLPTKETDK